jgi:hypothetical protein
MPKIRGSRGNFNGYSTEAERLPTDVELIDFPNLAVVFSC